MRKQLLNSIAVLTLAFGSTVVAMADNVVYGLLSSYSSGAGTTSFDLDKVNTTTATSLTKGFSYDNMTEVKCGATAGDKYFAFVSLMDEATYDESTALVTINFTTGNMVTVNDFSYNYGKPGYAASGMTYDENAGVLYTIETSFDDNNSYVTELYSVNQENGSMTKVTTWPGQYQAVATDHNGGFYLIKNENGDNWQLYPQLYKASIEGDVSELIKNATTSTGYASGNSMVVTEDGKHAYFVTGTYVIDYDLEAKTTATKGQLSDNVLGVSYGKSSADGIHNDAPVSKKSTRFLIESRTYGSSMGDISSDIDSKREYYYYNTEGKLVGGSEISRDYAEFGGVTDTFKPTEITKVKFDENGNMAKKYVYQWGVYDFDDYAWKKTKNDESYTYDENGTLIADTTSTVYHTYTYNEDGTLATKNSYIKTTKSLQQSITYSSYDDKGNAWHYSSTGSWDSYKYEADCEYDEDGNKIMELQYKVIDDPEFPGETMNVNTQYEVWGYDNGILSYYAKSLFDEDGNEVPYRKTDYKPVNGNINEIAVEDYTYSNGQWYEGELPRHLFYGDFAGMDEMTAMETMVENVPDQYNTVAVEFTVPQLAYTQDCKVVIYRDCMPIDTVGIFDVYDEAQGFCIYKDKELKNGTYTYFIQPLFSSYSEGPLDLDDDMGDGEDEATWTGYYTSMPMDIEVYTELPTVSGLKLTGGRVETTGSFVNLRKTYYADLSWNNPEDAEKYGFIKNSIYFEGAGVAEKDTADIAATNATVMLYDEDAMVYIVTSYKLGKAISESIPVTLKEIENMTAAIDDITTSGAKITFNGKNVTLSDKANVSVFSANGQQIYAGNNTDRISLDNMPNGNYIICVEKNGKVSAYKYSVK